MDAGEIRYVVRKPAERFLLWEGGEVEGVKGGALHWQGLWNNEIWLLAVKSREHQTSGEGKEER